MIDVFESCDARQLAKVLNELPEGTKVISIYSRGPSHWAWVQLPVDVAPAEPGQPVQNFASNDFKSKKRKGK